MKKTIIVALTLIMIIQAMLVGQFTSFAADDSVEKVVIEDLVWFPGYHGKYVTEVDENGEEHTYFRYTGFDNELLYNPYIEMKVYEKNSFRGPRTITLYSDSDFELITDQSYDNPWLPGNTYPARIVCGSCTCDFNITIKEMVPFDYEIRNGGAYITGWGEDTKKIYIFDPVVPEELGGYPVLGVDQIPLRAHIIRSLTISDTVETISYKAFDRLDCVTKVYLGKSVKNVTAGSFIGLQSLTEFVVAEDNPYLTAVDGVLYSKDMTKFIAYPVAKGKTYTIDSRATDLINTVYYEDITFKSANPLSLVTEGGVTYTADKKVLISCSGYRGEYIMPDTVEYILPEAFKEVGGITSVQISSRVKEIPDYAFENNDYLKTVKLPDKLESIGKRAFADCSILESVNLPRSLKNIYVEAFATTALKNISIPDSVTCVGMGSFKQTKATDVTVGRGVTHIGDSAFANNANLVTVNLCEGITTIGEYAFSDCVSLKNITIPDSTTTVKAGAFNNCSSLTFAPMGKNQTDIADYLYNGCSSITTVELKDGISYIGEFAFALCEKLETINIPDSVTFVGSCAFAKCRALKNAYISNKQSKISTQTFYLCTSVEAVVIGDNITEIGDRAFWYCTNLKAVAMTNSVTRIGTEALNDCSNLTTIYFGGTEDEWNSVSKSSSGISSGVNVIFFDKEKEMPVEKNGEIVMITYGDVNLDGVIDSRDSLTMKKYCAGLESDGDFCPGVADVYKDSKINAKDLLVLKKSLAQ